MGGCELCSEEVAESVSESEKTKVEPAGSVEVGIFGRWRLPFLEGLGDSGICILWKRSTSSRSTCSPA